jgi:hypothetical protein
MTRDVLSRLGDLDAAPRTNLTAAQIEHRDQLLRRVLADSAPSEAAPRTVVRRRPLMRRLLLTTAGAAAAGAAVLAVSGSLPGTEDSGPLSSSQLAGWTPGAEPLDTTTAEGREARKECLEVTEQYGDDTAPTTVTSADIRGSVASMVISDGSLSVYCLAASDGGAMSLRVERNSPDLAADAVMVDSLGARGSGSAQLNWALGFVGREVKKVTVRDSGRTIEATVQDGRWTAWWPQGDPEGIFDTVTVTLVDGSTRTVSALDALGD